MKTTTLIPFTVMAAFFCISISGECGERKRQITNIRLEDLKDLPEFKNFQIDTFKIVTYDKKGRLRYSYELRYSYDKERQVPYGKGRFEGTLYVLSEDSLLPGLVRKVRVYNPGYASEYHRVFIKNDSVAQGGFFEGVVKVLDKREKYDVFVEGEGFEKTASDKHQTVFRRKCPLKGIYEFEGAVHIAGKERRFLYHYAVI